MVKKPRPKSLEKRATENPAFLFDLDGTLMDTVYQHVLAWREALEIAGIELSVWRIHRRIGMSGGLFVNALLRETGHQLTKEEAIQLQRLHAKAYARLVNQVRPLPGARELLAYLSDAKVPPSRQVEGWRAPDQRSEILGVDLERTTVITRDLVQYAAEPRPLYRGRRQARVHIGSSVVVGDSVWDLLAARRAAALGIGLLSGGYGRDELESGRLSRLRGSC